MDSRTLRKIVAQLNEQNIAETRINGYKYKIEEQNNEIVAVAEGHGDIASSDILYSDYRYTHGGSVFREAVNWCHEIADYLAKFREADDSKIKIFADTLEYTQITRYFDEKFLEYDLAAANAEIQRNGKIFVLQWTKDGYECIYEY